MPAEIDYESDDICVLRVSGIWKRSDFAAAQKDVAERIDAGANPKLLAILENFQGWERGADWNDLDFLVSHSDKIAKIAIVAEPQWEMQALAFGGAGVRKPPVQFFFARPAGTRAQLDRQQKSPVNVFDSTKRVIHNQVGL